MFNESRFAWSTTFKLTGWYPVAGTLIVMIILLLTSTPVHTIPLFETGRVVESLIPLAIALQAAQVLAPDDEPVLELLLTYPRHAGWLLVERLAVIFTLHAGVMLIGAGVTAWLFDTGSPLEIVSRCLPPAILLSGLAVYMSLRTRQALLGMVIAGAVWFVFAFFAHGLIPGVTSFAFIEALQPIIWPINLYLPPDALSADDYMFNRAIIMMTGVGLLFMAMHWLADEERILTGHYALQEEG